MRGDARLVDIGLRDVLAEDMFAEARSGQGPPVRNGGAKASGAGAKGAEGEQEPAAAAKPGRKKAKGEEDARVRQITEFFTE